MDDIEAGYEDTILEAMVEEKTGKKVVLCPAIEVEDFKSLESSTVAILVDTRNEPGLILVNGKPLIPTGPDKTGIKLFVFCPGQGCDIFGRPSIRRFVEKNDAT